MCGICGIVGYGDEQITTRMRDTLAHRGPDSAGTMFFESAKVGLGHRRLKIIDLSSNAGQPMTQEDGSIWVVFNGEIYNFAELRTDLEKRGHRFRSNSDTEVILHLYEERGTKCFSELNGMFAVALFDKRTSKLILSRDHIGIKPLYYYHKGNRFVFGSEIKAILASGIYSPDLNRQGLYDYLTYLYVPCPETMFEGIFQLPPAHTLELDTRTGDVSIEQFWTLSAGDPEPRDDGGEASYAEMKNKLRSLLTDSVRRQMVSDVPLGVFLSGGIDSPLLTGLMAQFSTHPVKSFTIIFQGKDLQFYNEQDAAKLVAQRYRTEHYEIPVEIPAPAEMLDMVEFFDQPFGNPTAYLMYLISKHTRPLATVALCGAGGDELFAGYPRYRIAALSRTVKALARPLRGGMRHVLNLLSDNYQTMTLRRVRRFFDGLDKDFAKEFVQWTYFFTEEQKHALLNGNATGLLPSERISRQYISSATPSQLNRLLQFDVRTFLLDNILEYTDKMSMAVGLEVRVPFLDHRVVEHSLSIPFRHKLRGGKSKIVLKETFPDLLPEAIVNAPKKGFNAPLAAWMRDHLDGYFDVHMTRLEVERESLFNWEYIQLLRQEHQTGRRDNSYELFSLIMFDSWYRKYILQPVHSYA